MADGQQEQDRTEQATPFKLEEAKRNKWLDLRAKYRKVKAGQ